MKKKLLQQCLVLLSKNKIITTFLIVPILGFGQIQNNLLLDLDFENSLIDSSSQNQATSTFGASGFSSDKWGNANSAMQFSGTSNSGEVRLTNHMGSYKANFPVSFSAWVKINAFESVNSPILTTEDHGSAYSGFWLEVSPTGAVIASFGNGGGVSNANKKTFETSGGLININTWHHISVVFSSANDAVIYVDGFPKTTTATGGATTCYYYMVVGTAGKIGGYVKGTGNRTLNGCVDKVKIWDTTLSQSEIFALHYVDRNNNSTLLFNYNMNNNYIDTSIYHQTSAQLGTCQYEDDKMSYPNSALSISSTSAIEIQEANGNFKTGFPMTFATWLKLDGINPINPIFTNDDNTSSYTGMWIQVLADGTIGVNIGSGSGTNSNARRSYITVSSINADYQWRHLAVVLKAAPGPTQYTAEIYIDGVLQPLGAQSGSGGTLFYNTTSGNWGKLGHYNKGSLGTSVLVGAMDGAMFWNDSLSQTEILNLVNNYHNSCLTLPTINVVSNPTTICAGTAIALTANGAATYVWTGGIANGVTFTPASSETFTVTGTDANNCTNTTAVSVTVNPLPVVTINASTTSVCAGSSVTLSGNGANSYTWANGIIDGVAFTPTLPDTYEVIGTDTNSCADTAFISIPVNALPDVAITTSSNTISVNQTGAAYQWVDCNNGYLPISGATSQSYTATANGDYSVIVTLNGCSDTSTCNTISSVGVNSEVSDNNEINVYPNPASKQITIIKGKMNTYRIDLVDYTGKLVCSGLFVNDKINIDISEYSNGVYFLKCTSDERVLTQKLVVSH